MEAFKIQQAFNKMARDKIWKPYDRKAKANIFAGDSGSGVMINFDKGEEEKIIPIPLAEFLRQNDLKLEDFYHSSSV